ncbi:MAG TPA: AAA family ATPase [Candidatus Baltobacteraceae bacterium]|nr:AAA family ATPase [Candidatus Baltobacteraceae bacterium]
MQAEPLEKSDTLKSLSLGGWRQFDDITIAFHERLTIITGENATGKNTLMHLLGNAVGWDIPLASAPNLLRSVARFFGDVWRSFRSTPQDTPNVDVTQIGEIVLARLGTLQVRLYEGKDDTLRTRLEPITRLPGIYIPSHRPLFAPATPVAVRRRGLSLPEMFDEYQMRVRPAWTGERVERQGGAVSFLRVALNLMDAKDAQSFEEILRGVLPQSLGFDKLRMDHAGNRVLLETTTGSFDIDTVSGGVAALIDIAFQLFTYSARYSRFVALIDEPENHLHPAL